MPSTYRNVSAISLRANNSSNMLLDCGEGTYSQLNAHLGTEETENYLRELRMIYITHIHPDHNLGLFKVLAERKALEERLQRENPSFQPFKVGSILTLQPVFVVMPRNTLTILMEIEKSVQALNCLLISSQDIIDLNEGKPIANATEFFDAESFAELIDDEEGDALKALVTGNIESTQEAQIYNKRLPERLESFKQFLKDANLKTFHPVRVIHCPQSHGITISSNFGWKVTYSGDCRPTPDLACQGKNSTMLIHEATFQSSHLSQAKMKMHSTLAEAVKQGIKMNATSTVCTHFSQRYTVSESAQKSRDKSKSQEEEAIVKEYLETSGVLALDHLRFKLSDLAHLPYLSKGFNFGVSDDN